MKIQALYETQQEIDRLFIAGSAFSKGDPRLLRLVPVLEKMGEKAAVFKKMATDLRGLTECDPRESSGKLMAFSGLVYSVLFTQGEALEVGEGVQQAEQTPIYALDTVDTSRTYAQLRRVRDITQAGRRRLELLRDAHEGGIFTDFRTYSAVNDLFDDRYLELAEYASKEVAPSIGQAMIPFLLKGFVYEDSASQVRRLDALISLEAPQLSYMVPRLFEEDLPKLQATAFRYLEKDRANEGFLLKLTADKNKEVRKTAFRSLLRMGGVMALLRYGARLLRNAV